MTRSKPKANEPKTDTFEQAYPHIAEWVKTHGWIEIGQIDGFSNFILALDEGGMVWEGKKPYKTMAEAFQALEKGLSGWMKEQWGE
jgi:hypothetical protein